MSDFIHILLLKVELGPYSERHIRNSLAAGQLELTDLARYEPNKDWKPLSEVLANLPQPIVVAPPVSNPQTESLVPVTVLVAPAPSRIIEAPAVVEVIPGDLQPAVVLFSPLLPARQLLLIPNPTSDPTTTVAAATPAPPAPQLLPALKAPSEDSTDPKLKRREITPPPKPVVPYNQPIPRPGRTALEHWHAWGKYAAIILFLLLLIIWLSW
jgi:hypothetical protein